MIRLLALILSVRWSPFFRLFCSCCEEWLEDLNTVDLGNFERHNLFSLISDQKGEFLDLLKG